MHLRSILHIFGDRLAEEDEMGFMLDTVHESVIQTERKKRARTALSFLLSLRQLGQSGMTNDPKSAFSITTCNAMR